MTVPADDSGKTWVRVPPAPPGKKEEGVKALELTLEQLAWKLVGAKRICPKCKGIRDLPCESCGGKNYIYALPDAVRLRCPFRGGEGVAHEGLTHRSSCFVSAGSGNCLGYVPSTSLEVYLEALADLGFFVKLVRIGQWWIPVLYQGPEDSKYPWRGAHEGRTPHEAVLRALAIVLEAQGAVLEEKEARADYSAS